MMSERESMIYDVVVVGAGPAGLATAIGLKQLCAETQRDFSVCVVEKGSEVGAHILSGAVIDPRALAELFPDWQAKGAPLNQPVTEDRFLFLSEQGSVRTPGWMLPACFKNHGNYIASLGNLCRWMATQAESMGVEIYPGFAAAEILYGDDGRVRGVATGDMGIGRDGAKTARFQPGIDLEAKYTVCAEGCRGHLGRRPRGRRRGLPQRRAHQGHARRDQIRNARGAVGVRGARGRTRGRRARGLSARLRGELAARGAAPRAQLQAAHVQGALHGHPSRRRRPGPLRRARSLDTDARHTRQRKNPAQRTLQAER